jgi:hypothetical protein
MHRYWSPAHRHRLSQARAYCRHFAIPFKLNPSHSIFRFGQDPQASMGTLEIRIPTLNGGFLPVNVDVISINVPFSIGLDFLDREGLNCMTVENKLTCLKGNWSVPLESKLGHVYWKWDHDTVLFTKSELQRLHLQFYHPSVRKLYNLIRRAKPHEATSDTRALLEEKQRLVKLASTSQNARTASACRYLRILFSTRIWLSI